jgi:hypothetical protein
MKTSETKAVVFGFILGFGFLVVAGLASRATDGDPPLVPPDQVPAFGNFYTVQKFDGPPLPYNPFEGSGLPVYALGDNQFLVDDTDVNWEALENMMMEEQEENVPDGPYDPGFNYGCGLWLEIAVTNTTIVLLTLHNTREGQSYQIWTNGDLGQTNWAVETNLTGAPGDLTQLAMSMGGLTNLFFRASESRDYVTNFVFRGLSFSDIDGLVPDSMGAVGPDHFVELLNRQIAVFSKSGVKLAATNSKDFFGSGTHEMNDPRVLYDHQSNCWVALSLDLVTFEVILAVSTNQSPTNLATGWTKHVIPLPIGTNHADHPTLGMDGNGVYISTLINFGHTNKGQAVVAIKKKQLYEGSGSLIMTKWAITNGPPVWSIQPTVNFDNLNTNAYAWFVAKGPPDLGSNYLGGAILYRRLQWSGTNATLDGDWTVVTNTAYRDYYDLDGTNVSMSPDALQGVRAPQSGTSTNIDLHVAGSRLAMTVIRNGFLWTCQTVGLTNNGVYSGGETGANVDRSGVQWLKLSVDADAGTLSYNAHGRVYDPAPTNPFYYYYPSLMVNCAGDMILGFSASSTNDYIGAYYYWRLAGGAALGTPRPIQRGLTSFTAHSRWGDYSATTLESLAT